MNNVTCEFIATSRGIDRAETAEKLRRTHTVSKCSKCEKYHLWSLGTNPEHIRASIEARNAFYVQVGPNQYIKPHKSKKKDKDEE